EVQHLGLLRCRDSPISTKVRDPLAPITFLEMHIVAEPKVCGSHLPVNSTMPIMNRVAYFMAHGVLDPIYRAPSDGDEVGHRIERGATRPRALVFVDLRVIIDVLRG